MAVTPREKEGKEFATESQTIQENSAKESLKLCRLTATRSGLSESYQRGQREGKTREGGQVSRKTGEVVKEGGKFGCGLRSGPAFDMGSEIKNSKKGEQRRAGKTGGLGGGGGST